MTRIALVGIQGTLAVGIMTLGIVLLTGAELMPQHVVIGEIGNVGRMVVGGVEVVAGLCLLLPRGHVVGTVLIAFLTVAVLAVMVGRAMERDSVRVGWQGSTVTRSAVVSTCERNAGTPLRLSVARDLAI